ncbi:MAG: UDP-N-acetylmuramoyl-tripeptide--D-alanyl-D-alanine ligase [Phycisphaerales bacterium]|nr:UDP-N-acetylmuramoyl-tripeptide--D-alanyl-D-alanine ligase [Phycisphaerales bacterium]
MSFWTFDNIKSTLAGTWISRPDPASLPFGVSNDTRSIKPSQIYVAIRGERLDGNDFVANAAAAGSPLAVVDRPEKLPRSLPPNFGLIAVKDSGDALLKLASAYRTYLDGTRVIAVTGSNGKTTTTRLCEALLATSLRGTASPKSFNNRVGVPLTILNAKKGDQFLLCEVGTNAPGEIAELAQVVRPDIAVVTSIGREHLEGLGSISGAADEAAALLDAIKPSGTAIINADAPEINDRLPALASRGGWKVLRFGQSPDADLRITDIQTASDSVRFRLNDRTWYSVPLLGRHNAWNAAAAVAVARRMGVPQDVIELALANAKGAEMRLQKVCESGVQFINDSYNANPESMLASLDTFTSLFPEPIPHARRIAILGDMLELGVHAESCHREIACALARSSAFDAIILIGTHMRHAADEYALAGGTLPLTCIDRAAPNYAQQAADCLQPGDTVLLKASRGTALDRVIPAWRDRAARLAAPATSSTPNATVGR